MKLNARKLGRKWQFPLLAISAAAPVGPSIFCYLLPKNWALSWLFPAVCLLLACFGMLLKPKYRKPYGWAGFALQLLLGLLLLPAIHGINGIFLFCIPLLHGILLILILPMADLPRIKEPHGGFFILGLLLYPFWQIFYRVRITSGDSAMEPAYDGILACFLLFLALCLLSRNRNALTFASSGRFSLPGVMVGVNRVLILVFLGGVLLLGAVPSIGRVLAAPIVWAFQGVGALLALFLTKKASTSPPGLATEAEEIIEETLGKQEFEANTNLPVPVKLSETVMQILFLVFALILAYFVGRVLVMLVKFLLRMLSKLVQSSGHSSEEGYTDEISDVRDSVTSLRKEPKSKSSPALRRQTLSNGEQIRYRYRILKKRHPKWQSSETVRQQLPNRAAQVYERTRYGGKEASAADAQAFEQDTRRL